MAFGTNVFINCPFDTDYQLLLKPLIYTIKRIGLIPRISLERFDSFESRFEKINELMLESKYSIHDLSRIKSKAKNEYFRLNMPLELGVDFGIKSFHRNRKYRSKKVLVLEGEKYSVKKGLSDLSFADCKSHENKAEMIVTSTRNWFVESGLRRIPPPSQVWDDFNLFYSELFVRKRAEGFKKKDIDLIPIPEFIQFIDEVL